MKLHTRYPLVAAAAALAALLSVHPGSRAADAGPAKPDCRTGHEPDKVADDPRQPLDPRDPQFIQKQARRYRLWLHQGAASAPAQS
jgi:hypothetical protein